MIIIEEIMVVNISMVWTININEDVLKKFSKKEYYTLAPKVKLKTMNFIDQGDQEWSWSSHRLFLNEVYIAHLNVYDFFLDTNVWEPRP